MALKQKDTTIKIIFDFTLTLIGTICISPLLAYIAYRIKKEDGEEAIYCQHRLGIGGKLFNCYKFRSMCLEADKVLEKYLSENEEAKKEYEIYKKLKNDPRITPIGIKLRQSSLDELPQIFNVLKGDMSLVGPRPYLPNELEEMGENSELILSVKPGITGYWQVHGRSNCTFEERILLDTWYVKNRSLKMDLILLWKTIGVVLSKKGAY